MTVVNEIQWDLGAPHRFIGGMRSPYTRRVVVDADGKGDYTTLALALAYVNTVATVGSPWIIEFATPNTSIVEVGDFTLNAGVWLKGQGRHQTFFRGTPTMRCGSRMSDLRWTPTTSSSTVLHFQNDLSGHRATLDNCYGYLEKDQNAAIYGVKCSGSTSGALGMEFIGCKIYLANRQASAASAQMYMFHNETNTTTFVHFMNGVLKTSCGTTGSATAPELIWNQGQGVEAYVEITDSVWQAFFAVSPRRLRSENTSHVGADLSIRCRFKGATMAADIVAYSGATETDLYDGHFADLRAQSFKSPPAGRHLIVDASGKRDYTTINAAIAAATAATPATASRWVIDVRPGIYTELVDVPSFVTLNLGLGNLTSINGGTGADPTVTLRGRAVLVGGNISSTGQLAVRMVGDVLGGVPTIVGSVISASRDIDDVVTCVELTGSVFSGAFAHVFNCGTIYARNGHAGSSAKAVVFRLMDGGPALEAYNNHYKLSGGVPGSSDLRLAWNQSTDEYAQANVTGDLAIYNGETFYDLYSENTAAQHGGRIHAPHTGWVSEYGSDWSVPLRQTYDVGVDPSSNRYRHELLSLDTDELSINGTYQQPLRFSGRALWSDANGRLRYRTNTTDPANATDGMIVGGAPTAYASGKIYGPNPPLGKGTGAISLTTVRAVAHEVKESATFSAIGIDITTGGGAGALARLLIFADNGSGGVGNLVYDAGTADASTSSTHASRSITWTPAPGRYWLAVAPEVAGFSIRTCTGGVPFVPQPTNSSSVNNGYGGTHNVSIVVGNAFAYTTEASSAPYIVLTAA
jgi:hypothetical protein